MKCCLTINNDLMFNMKYNKNKTKQNRFIFLTCAPSAFAYLTLIRLKIIWLDRRIEKNKQTQTILIK